MTAQDPIPRLSLVVPFFNEEAAAEGVVDEIGRTLTAMGGPWEAILVDDGSTDRTSAVLKRTCAAWPSCRVLALPENRGQGEALFAGIQETRAPVIAMMDGDGQNPPADIGALLPLLDRADLVVGVRQGRNDSALRKALSAIANAVRGRLLGDHLTDAGCALKVFRREVADSFWPFPMLNPFMPALAISAGFKVAEHPVGHRPRTGGKSKYGLIAMAWRPLADMLSLWWVLRKKKGPR